LVITDDKKMKKVTMFLGLTLALAIVMVFATGCTNPWQRGAQEKAAERTAERILEDSLGENAQVDINENDGTTTVKTEEGETTWGATEIPENFPGDVPIYPEAKVTFAHVGAGGDGESASASLETGDSADKVSAWYKEAMNTNGWTVEGTDTWGAGAEKYVSYFGKQGNRDFSVGISSAEGVTMITLSVYQDSATSL
jgi:hypothetical protein